MSAPGTPETTETTETTETPATGEAPAPGGVEATAPAAHVLTLQAEVVGNSAASRWEAAGESWTPDMATGAVASLMLTIETITGAFAGALNVPQETLLQKVGEKVRAAKAAQAASAKPKIELAPVGFDPRRLRLARDETPGHPGHSPRRHPPGL